MSQQSLVKHQQTHVISLKAMLLRCIGIKPWSHAKELKYTKVRLKMNAFNVTGQIRNTCCVG